MALVVYRDDRFDAIAIRFRNFGSLIGLRSSLTFDAEFGANAAEPRLASALLKA